MSSSIPTPACLKCHTDLMVTRYSNPAGFGIRWTCRRDHGTGGDGHFSWIGLAPTKGAGVTEHLIGPLWQIMLSLPHSWIEHGVIEYQLRLRYEALFGGHVAAQGHVLIEGGPRETASGTRFMQGLRRLERDHYLTHERRPPTGAWAEHDSEISYWARTPAPPKTDTLTWESWCAENGREATWTKEDYSVVRRLREETPPIR